MFAPSIVVALFVSMALLPVCVRAMNDSTGGSPVDKFGKSSKIAPPDVLVAKNGTFYRNTSVRHKDVNLEKISAGVMRQMKREQCAHRVVPPYHNMSDVLEHSSNNQTFNFRPIMFINEGFVVEEHSWPWMVLIFARVQRTATNKGRSICAGVLINSHWVLTAKHCVEFEEGAALIDGALVFGAHQSGSHGSHACKFTPSDVQMHPSMDMALINADCCGLFVSEIVRPIALPEHDQDFGNMPAIPAVVAGWGRVPVLNSFDEPLAKFLRSAIQRTLPTQECWKKVSAFKNDGYRKNIIYQIWGNENATTPNKMSICVVGDDSKDTCSGDSGGPLMIFNQKEKRWVSIGVLSTGSTQCGSGMRPSAYVPISLQMTWIRSVINGTELKTVKW